MAATVTVQPHTIQRNEAPNFSRLCNVEPRSQVNHVGNYIIYDKTIGAGSMGTVKLAERLSDRDHTLYAVKIMPKVDLNAVSPKTRDPKDTPQEREQRTVREMAMLHLLHHPNICKLQEWVVQGDQYYMFLEYIQGGQLLDYIINHGKLKETLARKFARQIVSALDYCHRNSIVHRDLKIENILLTNDQEIKIIDFGLSNIYSPNRLLDTFCGSLYFAAPELLKAKYYTGPEVDVWSFGVVVYVLVCGRVPFDEVNLPTLHQKIKAGHVEYPDHLSKECIDLLSRILVVDPLKRISLSAVIHHPWMNKGYTELILNHLPHRQPLTHIDPHIVQGMQGFGLGTFEEIETKLLHHILSPEYQHAAAKIDKNHRNIRYSQNDDPQTLPAVYDPLVSIYFLVKEKRELDEKRMMLEGYPVRRSVSTSIVKPAGHPQLQRRKTERVTSTRPLEEKQVHLQRKMSDRGGSMKVSEDTLKTRSPSRGGRFIEEGLEEKSTSNIMPKPSTQPKTLFNFNRRHLFKVSAKDMTNYMQRVLSNLNIRNTPQEGYVWKCRVSDWKGYGSCQFTVMIFQARWAGGRLGVKLLEAEEEESTLYQRIYLSILNELDSIINKK